MRQVKQKTYPSMVLVPPLYNFGNGLARPQMQVNICLLASWTSARVLVLRVCSGSGWVQCADLGKRRFTLSHPFSSSSRGPACIGQFIPGKKQSDIQLRHFCSTLQRSLPFPCYPLPSTEHVPVLASPLGGRNGTSNSLGSFWKLACGSTRFFASAF